MSASAGLVLKDALAAPPEAVPSPPFRARTQGPHHLAWVWQFDIDGTPDQLASALAPNYVGVLVKAHDGTKWMSRWDRSMHAVSGPEQVTVLANHFERWGVPFHAWCVVEGQEPEREAEMCAQVIRAGARSMTIDLEPFKGFWQGTPESALAFGREFHRLQPGASLYVAVDPRPWIIAKTPVAEFASFSRGLCPMAYWETYNSSDNIRLFRKHGFPPGDAGVTPEFVLDVSNQVLSPYGVPIWPAGQGTSMRDDSWARFVKKSYELGMESVSVWRYGVANGAVWPLLRNMAPRLLNSRLDARSTIRSM